MPGRFSVDKLTSALVRTGEGPFTTVPGATVTATLDAAGSLALTMPASDPRAVLLIPNTLNYAQVVVDGDRSDQSRIGLLQERTTNPHTLELGLRGPNLLEELSFTNVGLLTLESAPGSGLPMAAADILDAILDGTGWTSIGTPSRAVYHKYGREKTLAALIKLAELTGDHFRISHAVARRIEWLPTTADGFVPVASGLTAKAVEDDDADSCLIVKDSLVVIKDGTRRITRLYASGSGNADAQLTINLSTLGVGNPGTGVDGDYVYGDYTLHIDHDRPDRSYIKHTVLDAAGSIGDVVTIGDATTIADTPTDDASAANELVERAIVILRRRLVDQVSLRLKLLHADLSRLVEGTSIRLQARVFVDGYEVLDLDEDWLILEVPVTYGAGDPEVAIVVTNLAVDRAPSGGNAPVQLTSGALHTLYEGLAAVRELANHEQQAVRAQYADTAGTATATTHGSTHVTSGADPVPVATTSVGGLMSAADKAKLDTLVLDRDVSATTIVNSAAQTSVYSYSVPGGTLGTTNKLRITIQASFLNNSASAGSPRPRVKYGATTIYDNVIPSAAVSANRHALTIVCELVAAGATNTQTAHGWTVVGGAAATAGVSTGNATLQGAVHESVAEDSTLAKTLEVTMQLAGADPAFSCTVDSVFVELLRN